LLWHRCIPYTKEFDPQLIACGQCHWAPLVFFFFADNFDEQKLSRETYHITGIIATSAKFRSTLQFVFFF